MFNENTMLNVLITRPTHKAQTLAKLLTQVNIACVRQPLFDYQSLADNQISQRLLTNNNIIIFVSASAVEFANRKFSVNHWQYQEIIAVGKATKEALAYLGINNIIYPEQENSEGLLALPELDKCFSNDAITIIRGASGREYLAEQLTHRGATVTYLESYQCIWRSFTNNVAQQWFEQQINCILVTSNAILEKLIQLTLTAQESGNNQHLKEYWRNQCIWVVASQRIANTAEKFGLTRVIISNGASESEIINTLQQLKNENK
jgi:uroporphyrinogen-III synthase